MEGGRVFISALSLGKKPKIHCPTESDGLFVALLALRWNTLTDEWAALCERIGRDSKTGESKTVGEAVTNSHGVD